MEKPLCTFVPCQCCTWQSLFVYAPFEMEMYEDMTASACEIEVVILIVCMLVYLITTYMEGTPSTRPCMTNKMAAIATVLHGGKVRFIVIIRL